MIRKLDSVKDVGVQITPASETTVFAGHDDQAKASVMIELKNRNPLKAVEVDGISAIIAGTIKGLDRGSVKIMDTTGRLYRTRKEDGWVTNVADRLDMQQAYANDLEANVRKVLSALGNDIFVAATVVLNAETKNVQETRREELLKTHDKTSMTMKGNGSVASEPGTKGQGDISNAGGAARSEEKETKNESSGLPSIEITSQTNIPPGDIKTQSVAVAIPIYVDDQKPESATAATAVVAKEEALDSTAKMDEITKLIMGATAVKKEDIHLSVIKVKRHSEPMEKPSLTEKLLDLLDKYSSTIVLGVLALVSLLIIFGIIRGTLAKTRVLGLEELRKVAKVDEPKIDISLEVPIKDEATKMRDNIKSVVNKNPRMVAGVLKKWIAEK